MEKIRGRISEYREILEGYYKFKISSENKIYISEIFATEEELKIWLTANLLEFTYETIQDGHCGFRNIGEDAPIVYKYVIKRIEIIN